VQAVVGTCYNLKSSRLADHRLTDQEDAVPVLNGFIEVQDGDYEIFVCLVATLLYSIKNICPEPAALRLSNIRIVEDIPRNSFEDDYILNFQLR